MALVDILRTVGRRLYGVLRLGITVLVSIVFLPYGLWRALTHGGRRRQQKILDEVRDLRRDQRREAKRMRKEARRLRREAG